MKAFGRSRNRTPVPPRQESSDGDRRSAGQASAHQPPEPPTDASRKFLEEFRDQVSRAGSPEGPALIAKIVEVLNRADTAEEAARDSEDRYQKSQSDLHQSDAYLAAVVQNSDDAIITKSLDGTITTWNHSAERLFGYSAAQAIGQPITMLLPADRREEERRITERLRRGERVDHIETRRVRKDGAEVEVSLTISPIRDSAGRIVGASKIARDITQRKQAEEQLRQAKEEAENANRAKDRFLAVLSHELRTPLTPVLLAVSAMEVDTTLPMALRADMTMIRAHVELERRLIDDLLDISRITSSKLQLSLVPVKLGKLIREVSEAHQPDAHSRSLRFVWALDDDPLLVQGDSPRLQQILRNLLGNAFKFTQAGGEVHITARRNGAGRVAVEVSDTGIGIAPERLSRLFEAFEQGDAGSTRRYGGLGLGLAICKSLVELHHGSIRVQSDGLGRGSKVMIELPAMSDGHN